MDLNVSSVIYRKDRIAQMQINYSLHMFFTIFSEELKNQNDLHVYFEQIINRSIPVNHSHANC